MLFPKSAETIFAVTFTRLPASKLLKPSRMMRKVHILRVFLVLIAIGATALVFSRTTAEKPCKEGLDSCCKPRESNHLIWENLSHQFFSSL
jgi:hypothetical protein